MDEPNAVHLQEQTLRLFPANGTPKLVATAIGNLTHILHDDHLGGVALGSLAYSLSGMPSMASSMLLENSHGVFDLVIWNGRAQVYNGTQAVTPPTSNVSVSLAGSATVAIYDPMKSANTLLTNSKVSSVTVGLSADPIILQIMPSGGSKNASTLVGAHVISNAETVQTTVTGLTPAFDPAHSGSSGSGAPSLAELAHLDLVGLHQGFAADYFMF
jgi:hypothetical protein